MRLHLEVSTAATELPWSRVLAPGRGLVYDLLAGAAPDLGACLHSSGWGPHGMVPFGFSPPVFPSVPRRRGTYAVGGRGYVEVGSPLPFVVEALARGLSGRGVLDWGGMALRLLDVREVEPPRFASGYARLRTDTPVVLKSSPAVDTNERSWLLPPEPGYSTWFEHNLRRKAETLNLPSEVDLDAVTWIGPKRSFVVGGGAKPGKQVEVVLSGPPVTLRAIWSWGLGQANAAGFGWIGASW